MTLDEARKNGEREAIVANLGRLKESEQFKVANLTTRTMMLAIECGVSSQIMTSKLKAFEIEI